MYLVYYDSFPTIIAKLVMCLSTNGERGIEGTC